MNDIFKLKVPQMGEGLRSTKVVRLLKAVGDWVAEDTDVIEVETAKATLGISSPVSGRIVNVFCKPGDDMAVDSVLLEIETSRIVQISCNENIQTRKRDLARNQAPQMPREQLSLIQAMHISCKVVVGASIESRLDWDAVDAIKRGYRAADRGFVPSALDIIVCAVAQAMKTFEKFRWHLAPDNAVKISQDCKIGIARSGDNDALQTAGLSLSGSETLRDTHTSIKSCLETSSDMTAYHSLAISDMSPFHVHRAAPVVVYPAVATLFIGTPYREYTGDRFIKHCNLVLSFDHRVMNGVYAAKFLNSVRACVLKLAGETPFDGELENEQGCRYGT